LSEPRAPFPWFGGKRRVADVVWRAFGPTCPNYVEPFAGSLAVLLARPGGAGKIETVNDLDCVGPDTRILKSDLTWVRAREVAVGDRLVGFDERNGPAHGPGLRAPTRYRRLANAKVTGVRFLTKPSYRLTFSDGTTVIASADHLWLGGSHKSGGRGWRWVKTASLVCNRRTQRSWVLKVADVVEREETFDAGWLGGMLDGEGCVQVGPGLRVDLSQKEGPVLDRAAHLLTLRGVEFSRRRATNCMQLVMTGGLAAQLSTLMRFRPERLIRKLGERLGELSLYGRNHRAVGLVSKEFLGEHTVVAIETDAHTFIAEGLASHNCDISNFWRAIQKDPAAVANSADWPVNEADLHARSLRMLETLPAHVERMHADPEHFDSERAGVWVWGVCTAIGGNWMQGKGKNATPRLCGWVRGNGMHALPAIGHSGRGSHSPERESLTSWFEDLSARLRRVRVACGDFERVLTGAVTGASNTLKNMGMSPCGVFLDPAYAGHEKKYLAEAGDASKRAAEWAIANGDDSHFRIALCGYEGEHTMPASWTEFAWKAQGGLGNRNKDNKNAARERIWFSKHCNALDQQRDLFSQAGA
jgi:DNA adenine methylase